MNDLRSGYTMNPIWFGVLVVVLIALASVLLIRQAGLSISLDVRQPAAVQPGQPTSSDKKLYYSTMHPWIVQDRPGSCPICGMELVEMPADMQAAWERNNRSV